MKNFWSIRHKNTLVATYDIPAGGAQFNKTITGCTVGEAIWIVHGRKSDSGDFSWIKIRPTAGVLDPITKGHGHYGLGNTPISGEELDDCQNNFVMFIATATSISFTGLNGTTPCRIHIYRHH